MIISSEKYWEMKAKIAELADQIQKSEARLAEVWDEGHDAWLAEAMSGCPEINPYRPAPGEKS